MIWYILLGLAVLAALVSLVAFVGTDRFAALWNALPAQARTVINVALGAVIAWALSDGVQLLLTLDLPPWAKVLLAGVSTAVVRAANPADDAYGKVTTPAQPSDGDSSSGDEVVVNPEDLEP